MADIELVIKIPEEVNEIILNTSFIVGFEIMMKQTAKEREQTNAIFSLIDAIRNGTPLPERHGDLKDIGNMELLNVQVRDDYSKGWHNAIEYCVRQLRERPTIIPATKEGDRE